MGGGDGREGEEASTRVGGVRLFDGRDGASAVAAWRNGSDNSVRHDRWSQRHVSGFFSSDSHHSDKGDESRRGGRVLGMLSIMSKGDGQSLTSERLLNVWLGVGKRLAHGTKYNHKQRIHPSLALLSSHHAIVGWVLSPHPSVCHHLWFYGYRKAGQQQITSLHHLPLEDQYQYLGHLEGRSIVLGLDRRTCWRVGIKGTGQP